MVVGLPGKVVREDGRIIKPENAIFEKESPHRRRNPDLRGNTSSTDTVGPKETEGP